MKTNQTIVACDPGVNGGFAIHTKDGILLFAMPESLPDMAQLLSGFKVADSHLWVEKVPKFVSKLTPSSSVATLHENYGIVQGLAYPRYGRILLDSVANDHAPIPRSGSASSSRRPRNSTLTSM